MVWRAYSKQSVLLFFLIFTLEGRKVWIGYNITFIFKTITFFG